TILVWDLAKDTWPPIGDDHPFDQKNLELLWTELMSADATRGYRAINRLAGAPDQTLPFFRDRLQAKTDSDTRMAERLIADLDSNQFPVREAAGKRLVELGELAEPALRRALESRPSTEVRKRAEAILSAARPIPSGSLLRELRGVW